MIYFLFFIAFISGVSFVPEKYFGPLHKYVPNNVRLRRRLQWVFVASLTMALLNMKIVPAALMVALIGGGMTILASWRDKMLHNDDLGNLGEEPDPNAKPAAAPSSSMGEKEAREVLGVEANANKEEIEKSYRKLMGQIHPDKGGTTYLATKINEARDVLLAGEK